MKKTWVDYITEAYRNLGGDADYDGLYRELGRLKGKPLTSAQQATVRKEIERKSRDSDNYDETADLFRSIGGIGSGHWGLKR
jgi:hypothetical protein